MQVPGIHNVRRHQPPVKKHGKQDKKAEKFLPGKIGFRKCIGIQDGNTEPHACSHRSNKNSYKVSPENLHSFIPYVGVGFHA